MIQITTLNILLKPTTQTQPFTQKHLIHNLNLTLTNHKQTTINKLIKHKPHLLTKLLKQNSNTHHHITLTLSHQTQQDSPHNLPTLKIQPLINILNQPHNHTIHTTNLLINTKTQHTTITILPELKQQHQQQQQHTKLTLNINNQHINKIKLNAQTNTTNKQLNHSIQLVTTHQPHKNLINTQQAPQLKINNTTTIKINTNNNQNQHTPSQITHIHNEHINKHYTLNLLTTNNKNLLKLINYKNKPTTQHNLNNHILKHSHQILTKTQQHKHPTLTTKKHTHNKHNKQPHT